MLKFIRTDVFGTWNPRQTTERNTDGDFVPTKHRHLFHLYFKSIPFEGRQNGKWKLGKEKEKGQEEKKKGSNWRKRPKRSRGQ